MLIARQSPSEVSVGVTDDTNISFLCLNGSKNPIRNPHGNEATADGQAACSRGLKFDDEDSSPLKSTRLIVNFDKFTTIERDTYLMNLRLLQRDREQFEYTAQNSMDQGYDMDSDEEVNSDTTGDEKYIGLEDKIDGEAGQDRDLSPWNSVSPSEDRSLRKNGSSLKGESRS
jgi:hypothetical protein